MATATKKPSTKAFVGSAKNTNKSKGLSKRLALFGLVGVLAFSTVAGLGWQKWQDHQLKAKAAGYTTIVSNVNWTLKACKASGGTNVTVRWFMSAKYAGNYKVNTGSGSYSSFYLGNYGSTGGTLTANYLSYFGGGPVGGSYGALLLQYITTC